MAEVNMTKLINLGALSTFKNSLVTYVGDTYVAQESGKGLSTNDYVTDDKNKLAAIAEGAQVNVLEGVKVNNTAVSITDKTVNITVPTKVSELTNDNSFATTTEVETAITNKGYQTASQVETAINNKMSTSLHYAVADTLPTEGTVGTIYLVPNTNNDGTNVKDEYLCTEAGRFELIGNTQTTLDIAVESDITALFA